MSLNSEHEAFCSRYLPMSRKLYGTAYILTQNAADAEDVVQDVMLRLWQIRHHLPPGGATEAMLNTMVRNQSIDLLRKRKHLVNEEDEPSAIADEPDTSATERMENRDSALRILQMAKQMGVDNVRILKLRLMDDLSFAEIGQRTGLSEGNARVIFCRTLKEIKQRIKNE